MSSNFSAPRRVILDLRCLQDPNYARRGVGRHTLALLRHAPVERNALRLVGLVDPDLPPLIDEAQELVLEQYTNAYAVMQADPAGEPPAAFVSLSPMTHDNLFVGRLLFDRRLRAAVVYDFIPRRWPERYLPGARERLAYASAIRSLANCNRFMPISESAADDLMNILGVSRSAIKVTGAPLDPLFEKARLSAKSGHGRHILVVGGGDPRKNPDIVVEAHARCQSLQTGAGVPFVIAGTYSPADADRFKALAVQHGGRADLIQVPGHVSEDELLAMYGRALAIVCPSWDEGFSLPVIEGMAAGVPVLASDIPAHRELVRDHSLLFKPGDAEALTDLLGRVATNVALRHLIVAQQSDVWPRFRAREVGARFWDALLAQPPQYAPRAPAVSRGHRPRVAILSPLPPDRSGVADYTAVTCSELGRLVELHVFTEAERPNAIPAVASISPLSAFPHVAPRYDRVISVVGNSHFHVRIFEMLLRYGGACIAHDARMLGFYCILLGRDRALSTASRELDRTVDDAELNDWLTDEGRLKALFLDEIQDAASPMIVHSRVTAARINARRGKSPAYLPFSIYRPWEKADLTAEKRAAARQRLGIEEHELAIVTFGFVDRGKAPADCIFALDILRGWGFRVSLHFIGEITPELLADLRHLSRRLGVSENVQFAEQFVSEQTYRDALVGGDCAVQLRTYTLGGLSGALLDCTAAGLPTVSNRSLTIAVETPDAYVSAIPDAISPVLIAEACANAFERGRGQDAAHHREEARAAFSHERSIATYARALCGILDLDLSVVSPTSRPKAQT